MCKKSKKEQKKGKYQYTVSVDDKHKKLTIKMTSRDENAEVEIDKSENIVVGSGAIKSCHDQAVGVLEVSVNNGMGHVKWIVNNIKRANNDGERITVKNHADYKKSIVIVLESPHCDEFSGSRALGPAMKDTGSNISEALCKNIFCYLTMRDDSDIGTYSNFNTAIENGQYCVYFVNAIQVQCSLGLSISEFGTVKKSIMKFLWDRQIVRDDFVKRLKTINPNVIINCCTIEKKEEVQEEIDKNFSCLKLMSVHPSSAFFYCGFKDA